MMRGKRYGRTGTCTLLVMLLTTVLLQRAGSGGGGSGDHVEDDQTLPTFGYRGCGGDDDGPRLSGEADGRRRREGEGLGRVEAAEACCHRSLGYLGRRTFCSCFCFVFVFFFLFLAGAAAAEERGGGRTQSCAPGLNTAPGQHCQRRHSPHGFLEMKIL
jgi:hypothetical protein